MYWYFALFEFIIGKVLYSKGVLDTEPVQLNL